MSEYEGVRLQIRALQSELVELMDRLMTRVDANSGDGLFRAWGGLLNLRDAIYDLGLVTVGNLTESGNLWGRARIDEESVAEIAELLDKLSKAWEEKDD